MKSYIGFKAMDMGFDAHMTLLYTGDLEDEYQEAVVRSYVNEQNLKYTEFHVERRSIAMFGYGGIPVVRVNVPGEMRRLRDKLIDLGIPSPSDFDWKPHITIKLNHDGVIRIPHIITLIGFDLY